MLRGIICLCLSQNSFIIKLHQRIRHIFASIKNIHFKGSTKHIRCYSYSSYFIIQWIACWVRRYVEVAERSGRDPAKDKRQYRKTKQKIRSFPNSIPVHSLQEDYHVWMSLIAHSTSDVRNISIFHDSKLRMSLLYSLNTPAIDNRHTYLSIFIRANKCMYLATYILFGWLYDALIHVVLVTLQR